MKHLSEVLLGYRQREIAEYVCLDVCSCTPNEKMFRRCSVGEMVTFSVRCTCSPPLADSQRAMVFSEEENDMLVNICSIQWHEYDSHISHSHQSQSGPEPQKQMPWKQTACQPPFSSKGWRFTQHIHISITLDAVMPRDQSFPITY